MSTKLNKLDIIERRLSELDRNAVSVKTKLNEVKIKVKGVEESTTFLNRQFEEQKQDVSDVKKSVSNLLP
jgi:predicted  nucleic acid-binding Zn-ribbon protein